MTTELPSAASAAAARLLRTDVKGVSVLDMTGMSQKNGSVTSHVRIGATPDAIRAQRIATGEADLVLGCDMLTAGAHDAISKMRTGRTHAVINTHQQTTGHFARQPDWQFPADEVQALIHESVEGRADYVDATRLATALMGDSIATNLFMLGFAGQRGLLPLSSNALMRAIELNGVAVAANQKAFLWGRRAAVDLKAVDPKFTEKLRQQFDGDLKLRFNLAPPLFSEKDANDHLQKAEYGAWMLKAFSVLAKFKGVRGTKLDLFGRTAERRMERQLIVEYGGLVRSLLERLTSAKHAQAVEIAALAEKIRGFGHVKEAAVARYRQDLASAMAVFEDKHATLDRAA